MARQKKYYKVMRNGESLQAYIGGVYVGSISIADLCLYIKHKKVKNTKGETTQP